MLDGRDLPIDRRGTRLSLRRILTLILPTFCLIGGRHALGLPQRRRVCKNGRAVYARVTKYHIVWRGVRCTIPRMTAPKRPAPLVRVSFHAPAWVRTLAGQIAHAQSSGDVFRTRAQILREFLEAGAKRQPQAPKEPK